MDVTGIDHIYLAVSDFPASEAFYDAVMRALDFRKSDRPIGGERHAHHFNRVLQLSIRPARSVQAPDLERAGPASPVFPGRLAERR